MIVEIKIPSVGESVKEAVIAEWFKSDGETVEKDEPLFVIETDKVTLEVVAEAAGRLTVTVAEGETVPVGATVGTIDTAAASPAAVPAVAEPEAAAPAAEPVPSVAPAAAAPEPSAPVETPPPAAVPMPPSVRRLVAEKNIDASRITGTGPGGRITKLDVLLHLEQAPAGIPEAPAEIPVPAEGGDTGISRKPMSPIRRRIADRLLEARQNTAMLTTFNEIDMSRAMAVRSRYKEAFAKRHGVSLGFMSFFVSASVAA